ncbi:MAG: ATP-binding protein [Hyphomonadaceae bacterium]|nr:ATP-binding protein [Hyphomonadaceae bacterium]
MTKHPYTMEVSFQALSHLGINLYSNISAVVSELVANAYDADAENVEIAIDDNSEVRISDDGVGMSENDINEKFLMVGYQKRKLERLTPIHKRLPMGRKGIGKLSVFSIAEVVRVYSHRKGHDPVAFEMRLAEIQDMIEKKGSSYSPAPIEYIAYNTHGTTIVLRNLKKRFRDTEAALRRRVARRFSIIGAATKFKVAVNGKEVSPADRGYEGKAQFVWTINPTAKTQFPKAENVMRIEPSLLATGYSGWIATAYDPKSLKDEGGQSLNNIVVMMRGKLAHEDLLEAIDDSGLYTKYLFGEIYADDLDDDSKEDMATTSRQRLVEDDDRFRNLASFAQLALRQIRREWATLRSEKGFERATEIPEIGGWFESLDAASANAARQLIGRVNRLSFDNEEERQKLLRSSVIAFESLRYSRNLDKLDRITDENMSVLVPIFKELDDIEASMYYQITKERVSIIRTLQEKVDENAKERALQEHVFEHLWLLDPSWERAANPDSTMEQRFVKLFKESSGVLKADEAQWRYDIAYKLASGKHLIIELKRAGRRMSFIDVFDQTQRYSQAMSKMLRSAGLGGESFEIVVVLGHEITEWADAEARERGINQLKLQNARVMHYDELLVRARRQYEDYIRASEKAGSLVNLLARIGEPLRDSFFEEEKVAP